VTVVAEFPHAVREIEHCWIPMSDGTRLGARLWLPAGARAAPVPAVLEYIPYGKREGTRSRDEPMHRYFAGHGYAAARVDVRGAGDSEGHLSDEYHEQELRDAQEVIAWLASQPWCNGAVGMIGKSWGGFNALQVAARRPPALGGVISVCASDDRYRDDAHYMGGCLLMENFSWGAALFGLVAQPPDPALVGEAWRDQWLERLAHAEPFATRWLRHPLRDAYWRHGSVSEDYARIQVPVHAVGGWTDGYSNAVPRLVAGLPGPRKGLVGPWPHVYPHEGAAPMPIGFLQEALRWWEQCLHGKSTGVLEGPAYRVWMAEQAPMRGRAGAGLPGRWVAEDTWPSPRIEPRRLVLGAGGLGDTASAAKPLRVCSPQDTGVAAGAWCAFGPGGYPGEQGPDDARSLCLDSAPLPERIEILGAPVVELELAVDRPLAFLALRLCEVTPDGSSGRVTYALANLTHDERHEVWRPIEPGARRRVCVALNDVAHAFRAGSRIRLALSTAYWPLAWPSPEPVTLTLFAGTGWLELPVRPPRPEDAHLPAFLPPETAPAPEVVDLHPGGVRRSLSLDPHSGETRLDVALDLDTEGRPGLSRIEPIDLDVGYGIRQRLAVHARDPLAARAETEHVSLVRRGSWEVRARSRTRVSADREHFRVEAELVAHEGDSEVCVRRWDERVPRQGI
jgi:putative CocE/NonD family hydrolase